MSESKGYEALRSAGDVTVGALAVGALWILAIILHVVMFVYLIYLGYQA